MNIISRTKLLIIITTLLLAAAFWYWGTKPESKQERYKTQAIDRGDIVQNISANGTLNPVEMVNVGTQVSGTIIKMYVDFNDQVKEGQVLAELDPALLRAQLQQSEGNLISARATAKLAENRMVRNRELREKSFISSDALELTEQQLDAARAQLAVSMAQLARDRANLNYSVIKSPISGVVVARNVDLGQTVAASFQTPTLFQIAKDLHQMQIDTNVAEADIGQLQPGLPVNFMVDAFHEREFAGTVKQVRLNPTIQQNVVTYNVVVVLANDDGALLPGMTANVRFAISRKSAVLRVPNAALRYKPVDTDADITPTATRQPGESALYRLENGRPVPINVKVGITDGSFTEITAAGIKEGDMVIVREKTDKDKAGSNVRFRMF